MEKTDQITNLSIAMQNTGSQKVIENGTFIDVTALLARCERMEKALEWYADQNNYDFLSILEGQSEITIDDGKRARESLGE